MTCKICSPQRTYDHIFSLKSSCHGVNEEKEHSKSSNNEMKSTTKTHLLGGGNHIN